MTVLDYGNLLINGAVVKYESAVKIEKGSKTRNVHPQINGSKIITTDISTNKSKITVPIRNTQESIAQFDTYYNNGDNNTITFRDQNFIGCVIEMLPEREDQGVTDYVFFGDPAI